MESRINLCLNRCRAEKRSALVVYATVGCPTPEESEVLIDRLIDAGADMIELGVPFSDPMADGPVIQRAGQVALKAGTTLPKILEIATRVRAAHPETRDVIFSGMDEGTYRAFCEYLREACRLAFDLYLFYSLRSGIRSNFTQRNRRIRWAWRCSHCSPSL